MNILNETNRPYVLDSVTQPIPLRHYWVFNAQQLDFMLTEIEYLEETEGPTITLLIDGSEVHVPGNWNILIIDEETYTIDAVPVTKCAAFEHQAFVFSPNDGKPIMEPVRVVNWSPKKTCVYPAVEKATALVHAITNGVSHGKTIPRGVIIGPNELWRHIGGKTVGDVLG
jgi:hypothetical protein